MQVRRPFVGRRNGHQVSLARSMQLIGQDCRGTDKAARGIWDLGHVSRQEYPPHAHSHVRDLPSLNFQHLILYAAMSLRNTIVFQ